MKNKNSENDHSKQNYPMRSATFRSLLETFLIQIEPMIDNWKGIKVYFPEHLEYMHLDLIWPLKAWFSQDCLCVSKKWQKGHF